MILPWIIAVPAVAALLAWAAGRVSAFAARTIALAALFIDLFLALSLAGTESGGRWLAEYACDWIPRFGVRIHFAMDEISLILVLLTAVLGLASVVVSWREIHANAGAFHAHLLLSLTGVLGVFLALDLVLFYFFWELMLVPMFFLILLWGHENRIYAGIKFFLFTQLSGLLMLLAILGLGFVHYRTTGHWSFAYEQLLITAPRGAAGFWLMLGFWIAFVVKLPMVPLHTWLPDAHTEAPTAGSVILAGLLLKSSAYGLLRFAIPMFPEASEALAPTAMALGVAGILYGAFQAFGQHDLKRLVAYTSVSHLGFVLLGLYAWNALALQGVIMQMVCHGLSTGGLFILAGIIQERTGARDLRHLGGLAAAAPRMSAVAMFLAMASLGLPGLGNFVAEFLILLGAFAVSPMLAGIAVLGLVAATVYALKMVQSAFHGPGPREWQINDLYVRELGVFAALIILLLWLGLYPQPVLDQAAAAIGHLEQQAVQLAEALR